MKIGREVGIFSRSHKYILENYFVAALAIKLIYAGKENSFKMDEFLKRRKRFSRLKNLRACDQASRGVYFAGDKKNGIKYFENLVYFKII